MHFTIFLPFVNFFGEKKLLARNQGNWLQIKPLCLVSITLKNYELKVGIINFPGISWIIEILCSTQTDSLLPKSSHLFLIRSLLFESGKN